MVDATVQSRPAIAPAVAVVAQRTGIYSRAANFEFDALALVADSVIPRI
jgi:hypothetical protein